MSLLKLNSLSATANNKVDNIILSLVSSSPYGLLKPLIFRDVFTYDYYYQNSEESVLATTLISDKYSVLTVPIITDNSPNCVGSLGVSVEKSNSNKITRFYYPKLLKGPIDPDELVNRLNKTSTDIFDINECEFNTINQSNVWRIDYSDLDPIDHQSVITDLNKIIISDKDETDIKTNSFISVESNRKLRLEVVPSNGYNNTQLSPYTSGVTAYGFYYISSGDELLRFIDEYIDSFSDPSEAKLSGFCNWLVTKWLISIDYSMMMSIIDLIDYDNTYTCQEYKSTYLDANNFYLSDHTDIRYIIANKLFNNVTVICKRASIKINGGFTSYSKVINAVEIGTAGLTYMSQLNSNIESNEYIRLEFYSKMRSTSNDIVVSMNPHHEFGYLGVYNLLVSRGTYAESYLVYISNKPNIETLDVVYIGDIGKYSILIDVKVMNAVSTVSGDYIDLNQIEDINDARLLEDPGFSFSDYLYNEEVDYINYDREFTKSLSQLNQYKYYPDFILITKLPKDALKLNSELNSVLKSLCNSQNQDCQVLININPADLNLSIGSRTDLPTKLYNFENRILYFYDNYELSGITYPVLYYYLLNILSDNALGLPDSDILYRPFDLITNNYIYIRYQLTPTSTPEYKLCKYYRSIGDNIYIDLDGEVKELTPSNNYEILDLKSKLEELKINYYDYNHYRYEYSTITEYKYGDNKTIFLIRFIQSRLSRLLLRNRSNLINNSKLKIMNLLNEIKQQVSTSSLIESINYKPTFSTNSLNLVFTIRTNSIINKELKLNFILNYN